MLELILVFIKIGMLTFGGGSAAAPLIKREFVDERGYITNDEFIDIVTSANMLPGPSMAQMAAIVGYNTKGVLGAIVASAAIIMPMTILFSVFGLLLVNHVKPETLMVYFQPAIMVISASMLLLAVEIFRSIEEDVNIIFSITVLILSLVMILVFSIHPSIMILLVFIGVYIYASIKSYS